MFSQITCLAGFQNNLRDVANSSLIQFGPTSAIQRGHDVVSGVGAVGLGGLLERHRVPTSDDLLFDDTDDVGLDRSRQSVVRRRQRRLASVVQLVRDSQAVDDALSADDVHLFSCLSVTPSTTPEAQATTAQR